MCRAGYSYTTVLKPGCVVLCGMGVSNLDFLGDPVMDPDSKASGSSRTIFGRNSGVRSNMVDGVAEGKLRTGPVAAGSPAQVTSPNRWSGPVTSSPHAMVAGSRSGLDLLLPQPLRPDGRCQGGFLNCYVQLRCPDGQQGSRNQKRCTWGSVTGGIGLALMTVQAHLLPMIEPERWVLWPQTPRLK